MSIHAKHKKSVKKTAYSKKIKDQVKKRMLSDGAKCRALGGTFNNQSGACTKALKGKNTKSTKKPSKAVITLGINF